MLNHQLNNTHSPSHRPLGGGLHGGRFEIVASPLTPAQTIVLSMRAVGISTANITRALDITDATLRTHDKAVRKQLGAHTMHGAVGVAFRSGILHPTEIAEFGGTLREPEQYILLGLDAGLTIPEIAVARGRGRATVTSQLKHLYARFDLQTDQSALVTMTHLTTMLHQHVVEPLVDLPQPQLANQ